MLQKKNEQEAQQCKFQVMFPKNLAVVQEISGSVRIRKITR